MELDPKVFHPRGVYVLCEFTENFDGESGIKVHSEYEDKADAIRHSMGPNMKVFGPVPFHRNYKMNPPSFPEYPSFPNLPNFPEYPKPQMPNIDFDQGPSFKK